MKLPVLLAFVGVLSFAAASTARADAIFGDLADYEINGNFNNGDNAFNVGDEDSSVLNVGSEGTRGSDGRNAVFIFDLSSVTDSIGSANLSIYYLSMTGTPDYDVDLYGIGFESGATSDKSSSRNYVKYENDSFGAHVAITDDFVTTATTAGQYVSLNAAGQAALAAYLNSRPAGQNFVYLRLNPAAPFEKNVYSGPKDNTYFSFASADATGTSTDPKLTISASVPEPASAASLALLGLGALLMLPRRRRVSLES